MDVLSSDADAPLTIRLLGPFDVRVRGEPLPRLRSRKGRWLLALLALRRGRAVERPWLAGTLWPESDERQALFNLRMSLTDLRHALGGEAGRFRAPGRSMLALDLSGADVDVAAFDDAVSAGDPAHLERAVTVYRGPLLEGCAEEWIIPERERREQEYLRALETLAASARGRKDFAVAASFLRRAVAADPLREPAQRALMEALAALGDHAGAIHAYRDLRLVLLRELRADPAPETTRLFQRLRSEARHQARTRPPSPPDPVSPPLSRLPRPLTVLIGREKEILEITDHLLVSRLVTITGPGGVGKTRLAIAVAENVADIYAHGAFWVDLAPLSDPDLVPQAIASTLNLREAPGRPLREMLAAALEARSLLLVLDNCEHLLPACASLAETLLRACPGLRVLTTSRQSLGIAGEIVWRTAPLSLPRREDAPAPGAATLAFWNESEAVRLFVARARAALSTFTLTEENAPRVAQVCVRLDGIALAIEMAAVRVRVLSVGGIAARLDDRFRLLVGGGTGLSRQQTLRATMDWSYHLLTPAEQALLRRLSVFAGGFTLESVEAVCGPAKDSGMDSLDSLDHLESLMDKSLLWRQEHAGNEPRFLLLETVREYARERLAQSGETDALRRRHAAHFLDLAETTEPKLHGPEQVKALDRLEGEHDNFRAALAWSQVQNNDAETSLRLSGALFWFWHLRSYLSEGRRWLEDALGRAVPAGASASSRARALQGAGQLAYYQADFGASRCRLEASATLWQEIGDARGHAYALAYLSAAHHFSGDTASAWRVVEECAVRARTAGDPWVLGMALWMLGTHTLFGRGDPEAAWPILEESAALFRQVGDKWGLSAPLFYLSRIAGRRGDRAAERSIFLESHTLTCEIGDRWRIAFGAHTLAEMTLADGDYERAAALFDESIALRRELGENNANLGGSYLGRGDVARYQAQPVAARRYYEDALRVHRQRGQKDGTALTLLRMGQLAQAEEEYEQARSLLNEGLITFRDLEDRAGLALSLEVLARLEATQRQAARATRLLGMARALREALGASVLTYDTPLEREMTNGDNAAARIALGQEAFAAAWADGRAMSLEQILKYALWDSEEKRMGAEGVWAPVQWSHGHDGV